MVMQNACQGVRSREALLALAARFPRFHRLDLTSLEDEHTSVTKHVNGLIEACTPQERAIITSITELEIEAYAEALEEELAGIFPAGI
jgi:hypothetical protein